MGDSIEKVKRAWATIDGCLSAAEQLRQIDPFWIEHARRCVDAVYGKLAPFPLGSRVVLVDPPEITNETAPGWIAHKHFLVAGATGVVADFRYEDDGYALGVVFDNQTWIPSGFSPNAGVPQPVSSPGQFWMKAERFIDARPTPEPKTGEKP